LQRVYTAAASEEYGISYGLLSQNFKASEGVTEAEWANTFADLQSIRFVEGPDARVSGNTATVEGVTIAENAGRTERNTVTWRMVKEGGGWKLDGIPTFRQEPVSG
jgi:serine/threonine-protein kinase